MLKFIKNHRVILYRAIILLIVGFGLLYLGLRGKLHIFFTWIMSMTISQKIHDSLIELFQDTHLIILILSVPIFFLLWLFRTHDTNQNRKNDETNLSANSFFNSLNLLTKNDQLSKQIAIKRLMHLRYNELYLKKEIELAINQSKLDLHDTNLSKINLSDLDLTEVNLIKTNLTGADLTGASLINAKLESVNLTGADLTSADLTSADLRGANLRGSDLRDASLISTDLTGAKSEGAKYNSKTKFQKGFNPKKYEMIEII